MCAKPKYFCKNCIGACLYFWLKKNIVPAKGWLSVGCYIPQVFAQKIGPPGKDV